MVRLQELFGVDPLLVLGLVHFRLQNQLQKMLDSDDTSNELIVAYLKSCRLMGPGESGILGEGQVRPLIDESRVSRTERTDIDCTLVLGNPRTTSPCSETSVLVHNHGISNGLVRVQVQRRVELVGRHLLLDPSNLDRLGLRGLMGILVVKATLEWSGWQHKYERPGLCNTSSWFSSNRGGDVVASLSRMELLTSRMVFGAGGLITALRKGWRFNVIIPNKKNALYIHTLSLKSWMFDT